MRQGGRRLRRHRLAHGEELARRVGELADGADGGARGHPPGVPRRAGEPAGGLPRGDRRRAGVRPRQGAALPRGGGQEGVTVETAAERAAKVGEVRRRLAEGAPMAAALAAAGLAATTYRRWAARLDQGGVAALADKPKSGRPPSAAASRRRSPTRRRGGRQRDEDGTIELDHACRRGGGPGTWRH